MKKLNSSLIQALKKVTAKEDSFYYFPPDEIHMLAEDKTKSKAIMKVALENMDDVKRLLSNTLKATEAAIDKAKNIISKDPTVANCEKFDKIMQEYHIEEKRLFDFLKNYY
jgi:hypothetical protein